MAIDTSGTGVDPTQLSLSESGDDELVVNRSAGGAWCCAEFVAENIAQVGVDAECLRHVALGGEGLHEELVASFPQWCQVHEMAGGTYAGGQLGPSDVQTAHGIGLEGPEMDVGQPDTLAFDPRCLVGGQKLPFGGEQRYQRRTPRPLPVANRDARFGAVHGLASSLDVYPRVAQTQLQVGSPIDRVRSEDVTQFRDQSIEGIVGGGWRAVGPDRFDQLAATGWAVPIAYQVGEEEATLAARHLTVESALAALDDKGAA